jgi:hypothetical protein
VLRRGAREVRALGRRARELRELPSWWHEARSAAAERGARPATADNPIVRENLLPGDPPSVWDIRGAGDPTIQGFATDLSVTAGGTVSFKVDTDAAAFRVEIFRLGFYRGRGARKVAELPGEAITARRQPPGVADPSVRLLDCGNWAVSAAWRVPDDAVSGVYLAKLTRTDTGGASHVPFVVRDDGAGADILFQTADTTWQAYNRFGGASLYTGSPTDNYETATRARKVSYNRPFITRGDDNGRSFLFSAEYPAIRFLERNGYHVAYATGIDTDRRGVDALRRHRVFLSVGHDEYWSAAQRGTVEAARDAGVHLIFLSGNEVFWRIRYEPSTVDGDSRRTLVCYKDSFDPADGDPSGEPTGTWRDPRLRVGANAPNIPENALTGTLFMANEADFPVAVTADEGRLRFWRHTGLDSMRSASTRLAPHTVGYESDEDPDNGYRPAGLIRLSTASGPSPQQMTGVGMDTVDVTTTHHLTLYRATSGSLVFSAGTVQWTWGLDRHHDGARSPADRRIQQATVNLLADMGVQPATLMPRLAPAAASTDTTAPVSTITSPAPDQKVVNGSVITVSGTAVDADGRVAGVEVSIDGGASWHPAVGTAAWSYSGLIHGDGEATILARATDDSANTEVPGPGVCVTLVGPGTLFGAARPAEPDGGEPGPTEVGVRFFSQIDGYVTGIRFYKGPANVGVHTGSLWSSDGVRLAHGEFVDESAEGWQVLEFDAEVPVSAGTTYIASYFAPVGRHAVTPDFFYFHDHTAWPLVAEATSADRGTCNGLRRDGAGFPTDAASAANYYVDPVFRR